MTPEKKQEEIEEIKGEENQAFEEREREIVVPGETVVSGKNYLPGDGTRRVKEDIVATKFGLAIVDGRTVKIIPLSGVYVPRRGNVVIGKVVDVTYNGWIIDINSAYQAFLSLMECRGFINKFDLHGYLNFGDMILATIKSVKSRGVDLTMRMKGMFKIEKGMIITINPSKVPRVIGKMGSMVKLIKEGTDTNITVGQNGLIWINSDDVEKSLFAKKVILKVVENSSTSGLTEKIKEYLEKHKKGKEE